MIQPILRSTTQRLFTTWNPRVPGFLLTTSTSIPRRAPCSTTAFLKPVSTQLLEMVGYFSFAWSLAAEAASALGGLVGRLRDHRPDPATPKAIADRAR